MQASTASVRKHQSNRAEWLADASGLMTGALFAYDESVIGVGITNSAMGDMGTAQHKEWAFMATKSSPR